MTCASNVRTWGLGIAGRTGHAPAQLNGIGQEPAELSALTSTPQSSCCFRNAGEECSEPGRGWWERGWEMAERGWGMAERGWGEGGVDGGAAADTSRR